MIGAGASILGRVLGGGSQTTQNTVNYRRLVRDAEAAGFNPLTALRNGGAAGYMRTTTPALSAGGIAGEVLGGVGNFLSNFDPMADQKREAEYQLVQAQIANLNASTTALTRPTPERLGSFNVPQYGAGQIERRPSGTAGTLSAPNPERFGRPMTPDVQSPEATNPWHRNSGILIDPNSPNAEAFEDRYGEFGGAVIGGGVNIYNDGMYNWEHNLKPWLGEIPTPYEWWTGTGKRGRLRPN